MRVAIPIWEDRVSPVFDTAENIAVAEVERGKVTSLSYNPIRERLLPSRAIILKRWKIKTLICGGISTYLNRLVEAQGIQVIPGIFGSHEEILQAYCRRDLTSPRFLMPGCRMGRRNRYGKGRSKF